MPATVVTEPASPTSVRACRTGTASVDRVQGRVDVGRGAGHLVAGRRVAVQVPLGHPDAADVDRDRPHGMLSPLIGPAAGRPEHELGRAAADVERPERAAVMPASSAVAPVNDSMASSDPVSTSGAIAEYLLDLAGELGRVARVPGGAGGYHAHRIEPTWPR